VSGLLANGPDEVGQAVADLNAATAVVSGFVADNTESLGVTSDKLTSVSAALVDSLDEIKQALHAAPTVLSNFNNIYEPAHGSLTGALALNNFANPLQFICSAVQAASRMNNEQSAKLCIQYLAPIMKNRQYNFLPFGLNLGVNAQARPNEVTYSEDWLRPLSQTPAPVAPPEAESVAPTDPAAGLPGLMMPQGGG
jgi:phospholipid/cholesterol/gamma-HCH transport system substrate-binding protein